MPELLAEERRIRIFGMFSIRVNRNEAVVAVKVEKCNFLISLQDFEGQPARIMSRNSAKDTEAFRIDRSGEIVPQSGFTGRRQRQLESWKILSDISDRNRVPRTLPVTAEVRVSVGHPWSRPIGFDICSGQRG